MVVVAQLVEPRIVIPVVEGSSPFIHPTRSMAQSGSAPGLGPGGRRFESYCSDQFFKAKEFMILSVIVHAPVAQLDRASAF